MAAPPTFFPPLSDAELAIFRTYREGRQDPDYSPRIQKRHAETMLELFRRDLHEVYALRMDGQTFVEIGKKLKVKEQAIRRRQTLAIMWMKLALIDD